DRILVTGGTGVVGSWVTRSLIEHGLTPVIFSRGETDAIGNSINGRLASKLLWARGDMLDQSSLDAALRDHQPRAIVHMASAKPWQIEQPFIDHPKSRAAIEQITVGTVNVLEAARQAGIPRVVYA